LDESVIKPTRNVPEPLESQLTRARAKRHPFTSGSLASAIGSAIITDVVLLLLGVASREPMRGAAILLALDVVMLLLWVPIQQWIFRTV
jgi:hypothetical protein